MDQPELWIVQVEISVNWGWIIVRNVALGYFLHQIQLKIVLHLMQINLMLLTIKLLAYKVNTLQLDFKSVWLYFQDINLVIQIVEILLGQMGLQIKTILLLMIVS